MSRLFRGAPAAGEGVPFPAPAGCYASSPSLARDGSSGAVWAAWYQWDCPQAGMFAAQVDPATGSFIGAPLQAPNPASASDTGLDSPSLSLDEEVALTNRPGRPGVYLADESGARGDAALWQVGAPAALTVRRRENAARQVRIAAEPGTGRLWLVWDEGGRFWVQRTTGDAVADGPSRPVSRPPDDSGDVLRLGDLEINACSGGLDLVCGLRRGDTPGALSWARLEP